MAQSAITFYDENGLITGTLKADEKTIELNQRMSMHRSLLGEYSEATHYIVEGEPVERPAQATEFADGVLTKLPTPCTIIVNGDEYPCVDTTATLSVEHPEALKIIVSAWPYLDKEFSYGN